MTSSGHIIVIGGGVIGSAVAYYLRRRGASVTMIDQGGIAGASSEGNAGLVVPSHFVPLAAPGVLTQGLSWMLNPESPFYIKARPSLGLLTWGARFALSSTHRHVERSAPLLRDLARESQALLRELALLPGVNFGYRENGLLMLFQTERTRKTLLLEAELAHRLGVNAELLDAAQLQQLESGVRLNAAGAVYYPDDAHLLPSRLMAVLREQVRLMGVRVHSSGFVKGFRIRDAKVSSVVTGDGEIEAEQFVLAAGSWSAQLARHAGLHLPLEPGKGYSVTIGRTGRMPERPLLLTEARVAVTPFRELLRFAGTMELAGLDASINNRRVQAMLKAAGRYLGDLEIPPPNLQTTWSGLRPVTPDGLPYIGRFKTVNNLIAATGHAMLGMTLAPVTGRLVADIAAGKRPAIDIAALSPDRFSRSGAS